MYISGHIDGIVQLHAVDNKPLRSSSLQPPVGLELFVLIPIPSSLSSIVHLFQMLISIRTTSCSLNVRTYMAKITSHSVAIRFAWPTHTYTHK